MGIDAGQQNFINTYASYAQIASQQTGVPWQTILAQWADETGWGTSQAFTSGHNFAGVSPGGSVASYPSISAGLNAYIQTLGSPLYAAVRNAAAQGPVAAAQALGVSPWAASHYAASGGGAGSDLVNIMNEAGLDPNGPATANLTSSWAQQGLGIITGGLDPAGLGLPGSGAASNILGAGAGAAGDVASSIAGDVVSTLLGAVEKPAIGALILILAAGLVGAGVWHAAQPHVKPALDDAKAKAGDAASLAAVAA